MTCRGVISLSLSLSLPRTFQVWAMHREEVLEAITKVLQVFIRLQARLSHLFLVLFSSSILFMVHVVLVHLD